MGGGYDYSRSPAQTRAPSPVTAAAPAQTPAQKAKDAVLGAERELSSGESAVADLERASAANDRGQWTTAHTRLTSVIDHCRVAIEHARATAGGSRPPDVEAQLHGMEARLADLRKANEQSAAPAGFKAVKNETALLAAVHAKPVGGAQVGYPRKEAEIKQLLDQLDPAESRALSARIAKPLPGDELAAAINNPSNLVPERRQRIVEFLQGARAREARRIAAVQRASAANATNAAPTSSVTAFTQAIAPHELAPVTNAPTHGDARAPAVPPAANARDGHAVSAHANDIGVPGLKHQNAAPSGAIVGVASSTAMRETEGETHDAGVESYLFMHREPAWQAITQLLVALPLPLPHPLTWRSRTLFSHFFVGAMRSTIDLDKPSDLHALVDTASGLAAVAFVIPKDRAWSAGVGAILAQFVVTAVGKATERVASRYLADLPLDVGGGALDRALAAAWKLSQAVEDPADTAARELAAAKGNTDDVNQRWKFLNALDRVDDPATRVRMKAHFFRLTGEQLDDVIAQADWHGGRDKAQAQALVSDDRAGAERELSAMPPDKRHELEMKAIDWASKLVGQTVKDDANDDVNAQEIFRVLGPRSAVEIEAIRAAMRNVSHGQHSLYEHLDRSLAHGNEDEAVNALAGDPLASAYNGIVNAGSNVPRIREILRGLDDNSTLAAWRTRYGVLASVQIVGATPAGDDRKELLAIVSGDQVGATRAHVSGLLADPLAGARFDGVKLDEQSERHREERSPEQVLAELERMAPDKLQHATTGKEDLSRFDDTTQQRIRLLLGGERVKAKALGLRDAIKRHDQKAIEAELAGANPAEQAQIQAEMQRLDKSMQQSVARIEGKQDWQSAKGRTLDTQLANHYDATAGSEISDTSIGGIGKTLEDKDSSHDDRIAAQEIAQGGELSLETKIYRARGDLQQKAQLLEGIPTNEKLRIVGGQYALTYRAEMVPAPTQSIGPIKIKEGSSRYDRDAARDALDANELRIDNIRRYGVPAERPPALQHALQAELYRKQYSRSLEYDEQLHEGLGGSIGSQETVREIHSAADDMLTSPVGFAPRELKSGASKDTFSHVESAETKALEVQRAEKQKHAAQWAAALVTIGKLAALCTGDPVLYAYLDILTTASAMVLQGFAAGEAYNPADDAKHLAIDAVVDLATAGFANAGKLGALARTVAIVGAQTAGGVTSDIVGGRSAGDIFEDALRGLALMLVPAAIGVRVQQMLGSATIFAKLARVTAEVGSAATLTGSVTAALSQGIGGAHNLGHELAPHETSVSEPAPHASSGDVAEQTQRPGPTTTHGQSDIEPGHASVGEPLQQGDLTSRESTLTATRREVMERYQEFTASDFQGVEDPRLKEIATAARGENEEVAHRVRAALMTAGVTEVEVTFRAKSLNSILGKLQETSGMKIKDIKDLSGVRINIKRINEAHFGQYDKIREVIQNEFGISDGAIKDYNRKPNQWGYTGRVHMFEAGGAEIYSEIQVGSQDLSEFIEKKFKMPDGKFIELHDLTGYKGQLYGKAVPPDLQVEYAALIKKITAVNEGGNNLANSPEAHGEVNAYFAKVQAFLSAP